jgi:hypothetical protein
MELLESTVGVRLAGADGPPCQLFAVTVAENVLDALLM